MHETVIEIPQALKPIVIYIYTQAYSYIASYIILIHYIYVMHVDL